MKQVLLVLLLGVMLIVAGCPLQTDAPVDSGSYTANSWLEGKWTTKSSTGTVKGYLVKKGSATGRLTVHTLTDGKAEEKGRPSVTSNVGGKIFISVYDDGDEVDDVGYYIFQIVKKSNSEFDLLPVKEHIVSSSASSEEIRNYLSSHLNDDIYEVKDTEHYKKG